MSLASYCQVKQLGTRSQNCEIELNASIQCVLYQGNELYLTNDKSLILGLNILYIHIQQKIVTYIVLTGKLKRTLENKVLIVLICLSL